MIMKPGLRKTALTAHVMFSVGWFGMVVVFLILSLVGMTSQDPQLVRAAYLAMKLAAWFAIVPSAFLSGLTGVISSLGTKWGLFRHYWVLLKLLITIGAAFLLMVHTQVVDLLASIAAKTGVLDAYPSGMQIKMIDTSGGTLVVLIMLTGLAVYKPRGRTPYGQQKQDERGRGSPQERSQRTRYRKRRKNAQAALFMQQSRSK